MPQHAKSAKDKKSIANSSEIAGVKETAKESILIGMEHAVENKARYLMKEHAAVVEPKFLKSTRQQYLKKAHQTNAGGPHQISTSKATLRQVTKDARIAHQKQTSDGLKRAGPLAKGVGMGVGAIVDYVEERSEGKSRADAAFGALAGVAAGVGIEAVAGPAAAPIIIGVLTSTSVATDKEEMEHLREAKEKSETQTKKPAQSSDHPNQNTHVNRAPSSAFNNNENTDNNETQTDITDDVDPLTAFGLSKEEGEKWGQMAVEQGITPQEFLSDLKTLAKWVADKKEDQSKANDKQNKKNDLLSDENVNHYLQFTGLMMSCGDAIKCPALKQAGKIAEAAIVIAKNLDSLLVASSTGAALGPIGAIVGAVVGVVCMFLDSGPNPTEIILNKLDKISDQIHALHEAMNENFRQVMKSQLIILETIDKGFRQLNLDLKEGIEAVRVDLGSRLEDLSKTLAYLVTLNHLNAEETAQLGLVRECASVNEWLKGLGDGAPSRRIPELSAGLCASATTAVCAAAPSLTGEVRFKAWHKGHQDPAIFNKSIYSGYTELNDMMGFLAAYVNTAVPDSAIVMNHFGGAAQTLVNPYIWHVAISHYIKLMMNYSDMDNDRNLIRFNNMLTAGENVHSIIKNMSENEKLWTHLIDGYYESVETVTKCLSNYGKSYSESLQESCNQEHPALLIRRNEHVLDILSNTPDEWIALFGEGKSVDKLSRQDIETTPNTGTVAGPHGQEPRQLEAMQPLRDKSRVQNSLTARTVLPSEFLGGEYFDLVKFEVVQLGSIEGIAENNPIPYTKKSTNFLVKYICKNIPVIPDPALGPTSINPNVNWSFPLQVSIKQKASDTNIATLTLSYSAEWIVPPKAGFSTFEGKEHDDPHMVSGFLCCQHAWSSGNEQMKYANYLVECVRAQWENPQQTITAATTRAISSDEQTQMKTQLVNYYYRERQKIALDLSQKSNSINARAKEHLAFQQALERLDMFTHLIQCYTYLIAKDVTQLDLLTSKKVREELISYVNNSIVDLTRSLSPSLVSETKMATSAATHNDRLSFNKIKGLNTLALRKLSRSHPLLLLRAGLNALHRYEIFKRLRQLEFPESTQCNSVEEYELKAVILQEQMFQTETYELFKELNSERFNDSKFRIQNQQRYFSNITANDYSQMYLESTRWAIQKSKSDVVIGNSLVSFNNIDPGNDDLITDIKSRQSVLSLLPRRGWVANLALLMRLAEQLSECKFEQVTPANFVMWGDGFICVLKLIYTSVLQRAAAEAGNGPNEQLATVKDCMKVGTELKTIITTLCTSQKLFSILFDKYLFCLRKIKIKAVGQLSAGYSTSEATALQAVAHSELWAFKRLTLFSVILKPLLELVYGYELAPKTLYPNRNELLKAINLRDQDELLDHLQKHRLVTNNSSFSAFASFESYCQKVTELKEQTLKKISGLKELSPEHNFGIPALDYLLDLGAKAIRSLEQACLVQETHEYRTGVKKKLAEAQKEELEKRKQIIIAAINEFEQHRLAALSPQKPNPAAQEIQQEKKEEKNPEDEQLSPEPLQTEMDNFIERAVPGDGNCLFYSIAYAILKNNTDANCRNKATELRQSVTKHMYKNLNEFKKYFNDENALRAYIKEMRQNSTWGDMLEIIVMSYHILKRPIVIIQRDAHRPPIFINEESKTSPIFLIYTFGLHYDAITPKEGIKRRELMHSIRSKATLNTLPHPSNQKIALRIFFRTNQEKLTIEQQEEIDLQRTILLSLQTATKQSVNKGGSIYSSSSTFFRNRKVKSDYQSVSGVYAPQIN